MARSGHGSDEVREKSGSERKRANQLSASAASEEGVGGGMEQRPLTPSQSGEWGRSWVGVAGVVVLSTEEGAVVLVALCMVLATEGSEWWEDMLAEAGLWVEVGEVFLLLLLVLLPARRTTGLKGFSKREAPTGETLRSGRAMM